ncbi:MAG: hypothetical protein FJZ01_16595 [Candidatus Sericytochromatia bacterium]|nr:hypothetical protein [Candidatus Tanganyikabacteria bacterium]
MVPRLAHCGLMRPLLDLFPFAAALPVGAGRRPGFRLVLRIGGLSGAGEVAPLPAFGTETHAAASAALPAAAGAIAAWRDLPGLLAGGDPEPIEAWLDEVLPAGLPATRSGLETCLLDALARARGLPLHGLLAGVAGKAGSATGEAGAGAALPLNAMVVAGPGCRDEALRAAAAGFGTIKVKVGALPATGAARLLRELSADLGTGVVLRADAGRSWAAPAAREFLAATADLPLAYVEEPCADLLAFLEAEPGARVAADESACPADRAWSWLAAPRVPEVFVLKPALFGGLLAARRFTIAARARSSAVVVTSALDGEIGHLAAAHLALAMPAAPPAFGPGALPAPPACGLGTLAQVPAPAGCWSIRGGRLHLPAGPGLGVPT